MHMSCLGLSLSTSFSFTLKDLQNDLNDLAHSPMEQEDLQSRFSLAVSLLSETQRDLFNYFPEDPSQDRIPMDLQRAITTFDGGYRAGRFGGYILVSQRCHSFFLYYIESLLVCLLIARRITLSPSDEEVPPAIDSLEETVRALGFTGLVPILETMRLYLPPPPSLEKDRPLRLSSAPPTPSPSPPTLDSSHILPTAYIPQSLEDPFDPQG